MLQYEDATVEGKVEYENATAERKVEYEDATVGTGTTYLVSHFYLPSTNLKPPRVRRGWRQPRAVERRRRRRQFSNFLSK